MPEPQQDEQHAAPAVGSTTSSLTLHHRDAVASTQDEAASLWEAGAAAPLAVLARSQSAGRGRLGRRFITPPDAAVALTVLLETSLPPTARSWIPLAAGLAVIDTLTQEPWSLALPAPSIAAAPTRSPGESPRERTGESPGTGIGLKWPNDIHTDDGRKLGGILVEGRGSSAVLVGIGLNLTGPVRDADGTMVPGTAWLLGPGSLTGVAGNGEWLRSQRCDLGERIAYAVPREVRALEATGGDADAAGTRSRYAVTCLTLGRDVQVEPLGQPTAGAETLRGRAREIDRLGRLVLRPAHGDDLPVDVGDVRHGPRERARG